MSNDKTAHVATEQPRNGALMPCGACVTNVYEAYEAGKRAAQAAKPLTPEQIAAALDAGEVRHQCVRNAATGQEFWTTAGSIEIRKIVRVIERAHSICEG